MSNKIQYAPPAYPPSRKPLLKPSSVSPYSVDLELLASQGWAALSISDSPSDPLHAAFSGLFQASGQFFNLPEDERKKFRVAPQADFQVSEEGYSHIPGEKCMITLRKAETTPSEFELRAKAEAAWRASGEVLRSVLATIEESLGMEPGALMRMTEAQLALPQEGTGNVATLMRMFRYDRPSAAPDAESRVVSEAHTDLGLLTIVLGHSPGLECWDATGKCWVACETGAGLNASILVGQTLAKFTNRRYTAGRHRVFVHPSSSTQESSGASPSDSLYSPAYRFSLVHALRAHLPLRVSYTDFETAVTGAYAPPTRFVDTSVSEIYREISNAHWNVNIAVANRRRQEQALREHAERESAERGDANATHTSLPVIYKEGFSLRLSKLKALLSCPPRQASVAE